MKMELDLWIPKYNIALEYQGNLKPSPASFAIHLHPSPFTLHPSPFTLPLSPFTLHLYLALLPLLKFHQLPLSLLYS